MLDVKRCDGQQHVLLYNTVVLGKLVNIPKL